MDERAKVQNETLKKIDDRLNEEGFTKQFVDLATRIYGARGGAEGLRDQLRRRARHRAEALRRLAARELKAHHELHRLVGDRVSVTVPRRRPHVAIRVAWSEWKPQTCDPSEECSSTFPPIRAHAELYRWLLETARFAERETINVRAALGDDVDFLSSKGAIVFVLHELLGLDFSDIALFVFVRVDGRAPPIKRQPLTSGAKAAAEALRSFLSRIGDTTVTSSRGTHDEARDGERAVAKARRQERSRSS